MVDLLIQFIKDKTKKEAYTINPDERIAQLVIMPVSLIAPVEAEELDDTERGAGGFGSTGKA